MSAFNRLFSLASFAAHLQAVKLDVALIASEVEAIVFQNPISRIRRIALRLRRQFRLIIGATLRSGF
jgi:hypothetical protein